MADLKNVRLIYLKGFLFLLGAILVGLLIVFEKPTLKVALLVAIVMWCAARFYYFMYYGTDWLAFGHLAIAVFFLGAIRDPVRNVWVIEAGMIACIGIIPLAFLCGPIRGIPFFWQLIDCSFGIVGIIPLLICRSYVRQIERVSP